MHFRATSIRSKIISSCIIRFRTSIRCKLWISSEQTHRKTLVELVFILFSSSWISFFVGWFGIESVHQLNLCVHYFSIKRNILHTKIRWVRKENLSQDIVEVCTNKLWLLNYFVDVVSLVFAPDPIFDRNDLYKNCYELNPAAWWTKNNELHCFEVKTSTAQRALFIDIAFCIATEKHRFSPLTLPAVKKWWAQLKLSTVDEHQCSHNLYFVVLTPTYISVQVDVSRSVRFPITFRIHRVSNFVITAVQRLANGPIDIHILAQAAVCRECVSDCVLFVFR